MTVLECSQNLWLISRLCLRWVTRASAPKHFLARMPTNWGWCAPTPKFCIPDHRQSGFSNHRRCVELCCAEVRVRPWRGCHDQPFTFNGGPEILCSISPTNILSTYNILQPCEIAFLQKKKKHIFLFLRTWKTTDTGINISLHMGPLNHFVRSKRRWCSSVRNFCWQCDNTSYWVGLSKCIWMK